MKLLSKILSVYPACFIEKNSNVKKTQQNYFENTKKSMLHNYTITYFYKQVSTLGVSEKSTKIQVNLSSDIKRKYKRNKVLI